MTDKSHVDIEISKHLQLIADGIKECLNEIAAENIGFSQWDIIKAKQIPERA